MSVRPLPPWVAPVLTGVELAALVALEGRNPLRPPTENKLVRDIRNLIVAASAAIPVALIETPVAQRFAAVVERKRWGLLKRLRLPVALETLLAVALLDYTMFAWHALAHRAPLLWRFHLVHHIDRDVDATTALRFHFGEMALSIPFRVLQVVTIGVSPRAFSIWQVLFSASILFHHSNLRLPERWERRLAKCMMTPRIHGIHHAATERLQNANLSAGLIFWDQLHGTLCRDVPQEAIAMGLPAYRSDEDAALDTIMTLPFRRQKDAWKIDSVDRPG